jgi:NTP pyrophosphatase (non-canonical NTP hydrolase)
MIENQETIAKWAHQTFGPASSLARVAARANEEMAELLRVVTAPFPDESKTVEEAADIVIILFRLAEMTGEDLLARIDRKMQVNRMREWKLSNDGHGYHVREKA